MAFIRDADNSFNYAFNNISSILRANNIIPPTQANSFSNNSPNVGIFIMPGKKRKTGALEDLCLKTINDTFILDNAKNYVSTVRKRKRKLGHISKRRLKSYLACTPKIIPRLGIAAKKGYFDFDSNHFSELNDFMEQFR